MNLRLIIFITALLMLFPASNVTGQEQPEHDFSSLLTGEKLENFLVNQKTFGTFRENFGYKAKIISPNNDILIKKDSIIRLEESNLPEYGTILIEGTVTITDTKDYPLKAQKIIITPSGKLIIGTNQSPIDRNKKTEIVFVNNQPGETGIFVFGKLEVHGNDIGPTFVKLASNANPGKQTLTVKELVKNWSERSKIIITSVGNDKEFKNCIEENNIERIEGTFIHLKNELECFHQGSNSDEISSHVAILTRNVKFSSEDLNKRGAITFFHGSNGYVKFAELNDLGPKNVLGRYPIHFHMMTDTSEGIEVIGNSIVNSENRWITIHNSYGILVKNNVGVNSVGHGFFLEDGSEFNNIFDSNIGIKTQRGSLIGSDGQASVFWTMNPQNSYVNNVAVDGWYYGFHLAIPSMNVKDPDENKVNLRSLSNQEFENNLSYNNRHAGLRIDRTLGEKDWETPSTITISNFMVVNDFNTNLNQWGIAVHADDVTIKDSKIFDSPIGIELGKRGNLVENTYVRIDNPIDEKILIAGILFSGQDNTVKDSFIKGYLENKLSSPSDILISNSHLNKKPISGYVIDTELSDPNTIYFGNPVNSDSFLQINGYNAPNDPQNGYPQNFILEKIDHKFLKEYEIDLNFFAMVVPMESNGQNYGKFERDIISSLDISREDQLILFKSKALGWDLNIISHDEFVSEIRILIDTGILQIAFADLENLDQYDFKIPNWTKQLTSFWNMGKITETEYLNALEFILESQLENEFAFYG